MNGDFTGVRYTTLDNVASYSLDPFFLMDVGLSHPIKWSRLAMEFSAQVRNIFNVYYETLSNHAMPGTNVAVRLNVKWSSLKSEN